MKVKFILPALTEAVSPYYRPIKYSLFPPLGLATLAGYLNPDDEITLEDEHVMPVRLDDEPDLVAIEVYITSAYRSYELADYYRQRGAHVCLGGLHVTSLPEEASRHADTIFLGPGEDTWPAFLRDFRSGHPMQKYSSSVRTLENMPTPRRDLIQRQHYLVPNSIVVSRGCPHACDFCYKEAFFKGGPSFYTHSVDAALKEIESLPGRHLYFLDDHLFGNPRFASVLFDGLQGMKRVWQAAGTVQSIHQHGLIEKAAKCGLRSLFVGFETLTPENLSAQRKNHNLRVDYADAIQRLHDLGVMVNGSFVFGLDEDQPDVFARTVEWAIKQGIETATFHILTPYPGTALYERITAQGRLLSRDWNRYDTRHALFQPAHMTATQLEAGYWQAYRDFYNWSSIMASAWAKPGFPDRLRHLAYTGAWKKAEPIWDWIVRKGYLPKFLPLLETVLDGFEKDSNKVVPNASIENSISEVIDV
jgi:radical SAM superfamily enzyme YgiQ (UPF0313 family)